MSYLRTVLANYAGADKPLVDLHLVGWSPTEGRIGRARIDAMGDDYIACTSSSGKKFYVAIPHIAVVQES